MFLYVFEGYFIRIIVIYIIRMRVETGLSPALTFKAACIGKCVIRYFKKNLRFKGLNSYKTALNTKTHISVNLNK